MKLKPIHKRRLLKLARFLRTEVAKREADGDLDLFDMFEWLRHDRNGHMHRRASLSCGTPACAAGWATAIFPELTYSIAHQHIHLRGEKCSRPWAVGFYDHIAKFFGLGRSVYQLFEPVHRAAEEEADLIERFVKRS